MELREAKREAFCRACDKAIKVGEEMITMHSYRNRGQYIHFCLQCADKIGWLARDRLAYD